MTMRLVPQLLALLLVLAPISAHICDIPGICPPGHKCVPDSPYSGNCVAESVCQEDTCPDKEICEEDGDAEGGYSCVCPPGTQRHDTQCVEFCNLPHPCTDPVMECVPTDTSYECHCPEKFVYREEKCVPACKSEVCPDNMSCLLESSTTVSCLCDEQELLEDEETCQPACNTTSCPKHMTCKVEDAGYQCRCPTGFVFTGEEECVPECELDPCQEGESCVEHEGVYQCCPNGHLPHPDTRECTPTCEIPDICPAGLQCLNLMEGGTHSCICPDDKTFNPAGECVEFCDVGTSCPSGMECTGQERGFNCSCQGEQCLKCTDNPCPDTFLCIQNEFTHQCVCDEGYQLKHGKCVDIDECVNPSTCKFGGAQCTNTEGGYTCTCSKNSYYNDTSNSCDLYNMCHADPCDTTKTGMGCASLGAAGFACICPEDYPAEQCAEQDPCDCGDLEECVGKDGDYVCQCDHYSYLAISGSSQECSRDGDIEDSAVINPKKGVVFTFKLGSSDRIQLQTNDTEKDRRSHWQFVSWYKLDRSLLITTGKTATPQGHFSTPFNRQQVVIRNVLPEDAGTYMIKVEKPGYRPVTDTVTVQIEPALTADYGPRDLNKGKQWRFRVHVRARLAPGSTISWYRDTGVGRLELLESDGRQLTTDPVPGKYLARLRGVLSGPSQTPITAEVEFNAE